ncbi:hypothetical protein PHYPSEUDO_012255 [Phytophthora pseudosyringae]|uniref:Transglutaminase elicitor n=1 Tax=Phytophthora pseudosyringae TaxID=221518 RepID=A0A8T1V9R3_9STRA|nr:hypothetical protein PHYPSEUDO_012255 [Phytophthora pseudosyringae]
MVYTPRRYLLPAAAALVAVQMQQAAASSLYYDPFTSANTTDEISSKFPARGAHVADQDCAITVEVDPTLPNITTISTVTVTYTELLANTTTAPTESVSTKVGTVVYSEAAPASGADQDAYTTTTSTSTSTSTTSTTQSSSTSSSSGATMHSKTGTTVSQTSTSTSTATSTKTGVTSAPAAANSVAGSSAEQETTSSATPSSKTGATTATTTAPTTSASVAGSSSEQTTTSTAVPATTPPATSSSVGGASEQEPNCATGWEDQSSRKLRHSPMSGRKLQEKIETKRQLEANTNKDIAKLEAYFGTSMETTLANLPTVGVHTPSPWPGPYWPTYQDGINVVWSAGEPSAAEKYATAFGLDPTDFMDKVSADNGIDSMSSHTVCSSDTDCSSLTDGSSCSIRAGKSSGYCIPTWYGICHAWTPASMLEDEPQCAVTHNGVTFQPMDLKALISDIYDGATVTTVFTGTRYNGGTDSEDSYGRHSSDAYRDLNPAYFHIAATNLLGSLNATFIADVTAGSEVWNQPVRGFKVYEQTEMTLAEAASTFYGLEEYPWNAAAKSIVYVKTRLSWIFETYTDGPLVSSGSVDKYTTGAYYYYLLEMDDSGVIIGGEWVYDSDDDHPDFIWFPKAKPSADTVTSIGLSYADVTMLLEKSVACEGSSSGSVDAGSSASASASVSASASASTTGSAPSSSSASTASSGSTAFSSVPGSASTGSAPFTASTAGSEDAATVAPVATEASTSPSTTAPVSTTATPAATTVPVSTAATPAVTTATSSGNQGNNQYWSGHWGNDDSDDSQQQQGQTWFHWW